MPVIQPFRGDRTDAIATRVPVEDRRSRWLTWRIVVPILTLLFLVYPAVMTIPRSAQMVPSSIVTQPVPVQTGIKETCPPVDRCVGVALEQALPRLPVPSFLLLAFVVIALAMHWHYRAPARQRDWWPPPDQQRALLQVFLI